MGPGGRLPLPVLFSKLFFLTGGKIAQILVESNFFQNVRLLALRPRGFIYEVDEAINPGGIVGHSWLKIPARSALTAVNPGGGVPAYQVCGQEPHGITAISQKFKGALQVGAGLCLAAHYEWSAMGEGNG
jgi:hypothetical protein